jgi:MATE family, multidrug efflux pump
LSPPPRPVANTLLDGPILRTLLSLAWPNALAFSAGTFVAIAETSYIGKLGIEALAAMALVFPCVMLTMSMSGAAMGGGVASAISRALGAGDREPTLLHLTMVCPHAAKPRQADASVEARQELSEK